MQIIPIGRSRSVESARRFVNSDMQLALVVFIAKVLTRSVIDIERAESREQMSTPRLHSRHCALTCLLSNGSRSSRVSIFVVTAGPIKLCRGAVFAIGR